MRKNIISLGVILVALNGVALGNDHQAVDPFFSSASFCESIFPNEYTLPATFGNKNYCFRIQVQDGGKLSVDTADTGCANYDAGNAYNGAPISTYQRTDPGGEAVYEGAWSGSISLLQDSSLEQAMFEISKKCRKKYFTGTLTVPSCATSKSPSPPLIGNCDSNRLIGKELFFTHREFEQDCYKVELFRGGKLTVDTRNNYCTSWSFSEVAVLSQLSSLEGNKFMFQYYLDGKLDGMLDGSLEIKFDCNLVENQVKADFGIEKFSIEITYPECPY